MKIVALDMPDTGWAYALACRALGFVPRYYGAKPETLTVAPPKPGDDLTMRDAPRFACAHGEVLTSRCDACGRKPNWDDPVEPPIPDISLHRMIAAFDAKYAYMRRADDYAAPIPARDTMARELLALRKWARGAIAWLEAATGSMRDLELPPTNVPDTAAAGRRLLP